MSYLALTHTHTKKIETYKNLIKKKNKSDLCSIWNVDYFDRAKLWHFYWINH